MKALYKVSCGQERGYITLMHARRRQHKVMQVCSTVVLSPDPSATPRKREKVGSGENRQVLVDYRNSGIAGKSAMPIRALVHILLHNNDN